MGIGVHTKILYRGPEFLGSSLPGTSNSWLYQIVHDEDDDAMLDIDTKWDAEVGMTIILKHAHF